MSNNCTRKEIETVEKIPKKLSSREGVKMIGTWIFSLMKYNPTSPQIINLSLYWDGKAKYKDQ